jgi:hypothetical protein
LKPGYGKMDQVSAEEGITSGKMVDEFHKLK